MLAVGAAGCLGGQTGGEGNPSETPDRANCLEVIESIALDEVVSALGFSGAAAVAPVLGSHEASLTWLTDTQPVSYGPEQGVSSIEVVVELGEAGTARWVHTVPVEQEGPSTDLAPACASDRLELDVRVMLTTAGGALAESFEATLVAAELRALRLSAELPLDALSGSFAVSVPEGYATRSLLVEASWREQRFDGSLSGLLEGGPPRSGATDTDSPVPNRLVTYAAWPAAPDP